MIIEENIKSAIVSAIEQLHNISLSIESILLQPTKPEFEGNFTFVTFPLAKNIKKSPEETGNVIGEYLINNVKIISKYNVVKGFLNISISDKFWIQTLTNIAKDIDFGQFSSNNKMRF